MKECPKCEFCYHDEINVCPNDQTPTRFSLPGPQLLAERYMLERKLGKGAMGQVYLAKDQNLGTRRVAVKTVLQDLLSSENLQEGEAIIRFEREAQSAASIQHPNIVSVTDFGETKDGVFYLVMEYVEGETLHRLLRREGTLPIKRAVKILRQIADGVEAAHETGILHRDLKPANIFILQRGGAGDGFIKVGDFGLAKIMDDQAGGYNSEETPSSRGIIGTLEFMSPEQMQPELGIDKRTDIYALGTIAYLMLGGRIPFIGAQTQLVLQKIMHPAPPLSTLRTDIPARVEAVIMRSLETDPNRRPRTITEFITDLEKAADEMDERKITGSSRLVILAPIGAEVYVNDERKGSIGSSGRLVLSTIPSGQHILRVSKPGEKDDERVIELREGAEEQVIQAHLKPLRGATSSQPSPSQGSQGGGTQSSIMPGIVACTNCQARFAEGVKFCGRCGNRNFVMVSPGGNQLMQNCPRCSTQLPALSKFCGRCGLHFNQQNNNQNTRAAGFYSNPISQPPNRMPPPSVQKACRRCGASFPPNIRFCGRCGYTLN